MIVTVTPNPALDFTYQLPAVSLEESHRVSPAAARAGGKGVNVARVLYRQGIPVLSLSTAGGRPGLEFAADLNASGIPNRLTPVQADTRRTMALVEKGTSRTSIFNEFGANNTLAEWDTFADTVGTALSDATCLVASGSLPAGADTDFYARLVTLARAQGIPSVVDAAGPALLAAAHAGVTLVKPNKQELAESTGEEDPVLAARFLIGQGARNVLVSLGEQGMLLLSAADPGAPWQARLPRVLTGNATGAGDAAVAAVATIFSNAFSNGIASDDVDPRAILTLATSWSAAAVLMPFAGDISSTHGALAAELIISQVSVAHRTPSSPSEDTVHGHRRREDTL